jgi:hypothetical protein
MTIKSIFQKRKLSIVAFFCFATIISAQTVTPEQWLKNQSQPIFKTGHTLKLLGQLHCFDASPNLRAELAANWGYAVRLGRPSGNAQLAKLCNDNPAKYKADVMVANLANMEGNTTIAWPTGTFLRKADGSLVSGKQLFSPEMPDAAYQFLIDEALKQISGQLTGAQNPPEVIENWTESGINVPTFYADYGSGYGTQDPKVVAAKGALDWRTYISTRKAHYEGLMRTAVKKKYPKAFYTAYGVGGNAGHVWGWEYENTKATSDLPSPEYYYKNFNTGFENNGSHKDMMTYLTWKKGEEIAQGEKYHYGWLSAGWSGNVGDMQRWMGYLKMNYSMGMLGAASTGSFDCGNPYAANFDSKMPPKWLEQMAVLGEAQAMFSWLEPVVRNSELLDGGGDHIWCKLFPYLCYPPPLPQPSRLFEFPTGNPNSRAVVRKVNGEDKWLITAWSADSVTRKVTITVPSLGAYSITSRPCGTTHLVEKKAGVVSFKWFDENCMNPSQTASKLSIGTIATEDQSFDNEALVVIFPNPTDQNINVAYTLTEQSKVEISVCDLVGRSILSQPNTLQFSGKQQLNIDVSALPNGIYVVKIKINDVPFLKKLVVER